jgi:hypothetical protein
MRPSDIRRCGAALAFASSLFGCAQSDPVGNGGASVGGSGSGGEETSPASNTTGNDCVEQPCKLIAPQCGCDEGFGCTLDAQGDRVCLAAGAVAPGGACSATDLCAPGSVCAGAGEGLYACATFCESDDACEAPGGKCIVPLGDSEVLLCSESCNLLSNEGCLTGLACRFAQAGDAIYTACGVAGTSPAEAECLADSECRPGHACLPSSLGGKRCLEWCDVAAPSCPLGSDCGPVQVGGAPLVIGDVTYGACNPN